MANASEHTMSSVEQKIHQICESINFPYFYMNWTQANVSLDGITQPSVVFVLPPSGVMTINQKRGRAYDRPDAQIAFLTPMDFDFDGCETEDIIEQMKRMAIQFIIAVNESGLFETIDGEIRYQTLYDHLDENLAGVVITLGLQETEGVILCDGIYRASDPEGEKDDDDDDESTEG